MNSKKIIIELEEITSLLYPLDKNANCKKCSESIKNYLENDIKTKLDMFIYDFLYQNIVSNNEVIEIKKDEKENIPDFKRILEKYNNIINYKSELEIKIVLTNYLHKIGALYYLNNGGFKFNYEVEVDIEKYYEDELNEIDNRFKKMNNVVEDVKKYSLDNIKVTINIPDSKETNINVNYKNVKIIENEKNIRFEKLISITLPYFFAYNNFGYLNEYGYGSYKIINIKNDDSSRELEVLKNIVKFEALMQLYNSQEFFYKIISSDVRKKNKDEVNKFVLSLNETIKKYYSYYIDIINTVSPEKINDNKYIENKILNFNSESNNIEKTVVIKDEILYKPFGDLIYLIPKSKKMCDLLKIYKRVYFDNVFRNFNDNVQILPSDMKEIFSKYDINLICVPQNDEIFSYHTFIYPFSYEDDNNNFYNHIKENWIKACKYTNNKKDFYNGYQYFNEKARRLVYGNIDEKEKNHSNQILECEMFDEFYKNERPKYRYKISLDTNEDKDEEYILDIDCITIKLYHQYKIGILSIDLINRRQSTIDDIKKINNYGRRVFLPCLFDIKSKNIMIDEYNKSNFSITACKLEILDASNNDELIITEDFVNKANCIYNNNIVNNKNISEEDEHYGDYLKCIKNYSSNFVKRILLYNKRKSDKTDELVISPLLDDRMFVASMINYQHIDTIFRKSIEDIPIAKKLELYPVLFLDTYSTCQNKSMINDLFNKHLYLRWTGYGSLDCITEYGFVKLTNGMNEASVGPPFLNMYMDMIKIALLQRCKLEAIESRVSNLNFDNKNKVNFEEIDEIWEELITYKKDLGMKVLTFQEQGVECYDILRKSLRIDEIEAYVDDEMKKIHEYVELQKQNRTNKAIKLLTVVTVLIGSQALVVQLINDYIFGKKEVFIFICAIIDVFLLLRILIQMKKTISSDFIEKLKNELIDDIFIVLALVVLIVTFIIIIA